MPTRRALVAAVVVLLAASSVARASSPPQQDGPAVGCTAGGGGYTVVSEPGPYQERPGELTVLASEVDGQPIQVGVVRPDVPAGVTVPVIAFASPYLAGGIDENLSDCRPRLTENFVPHGYAVAFVPVRGTADSGDCMHLMGPAERADLDQAVTWLGTQAWSNGNVGMIGVSYDGSTPWMVASEGNPHLKTIVPISGVNDFYHLMYRNGGNENRGLLILNALYYQYGFVEYREGAGRSTERMVSGAACAESFRGFAAAGYSYATGERDPMGFWAERNTRPLVEQHYDGSILLVQGLQDWNVDPGHAYPWVNELEARGVYVKHLLGQWGHAWPDSPDPTGRPPTKRWDWADMLLDWFDHWLKDETSIDLGARAEVQDTSGAWRREASWPPPGATPLVFHLRADGTLDPSAGGAEGVELVTGVDTDPVRCSNCVAFQTEPFAEDFRLTGLPELRVRVTPTAAGGHLAARLYAGDRQYLYAIEQDVVVLRDLVGWGQEDLRFPDGGEVAHPVVPGIPIDLVLRFQPLDAVVSAGKRLTLVLDLGAYGDHDPTLPTGPLLVDVGGTGATLTVLTHSPDPGSYFEPPLPGAG